jgi:hypothetical protein
VAYAITYLIKVEGIEFNRLMRPSHRVGAAYFEDVPRGYESDLRDGMLAGDDFLIDPWNSRFDYLLVRHPREIEKFVDWLQTQDPLHWAKLPAPLPE